MEASIVYNTQDPEVAMENIFPQDKRAHVTTLPRGFKTVRITQLMFTVIILGLSAADFADDPNVQSFIGMITAIMGTIIYGWIMLTYWVPSLYNYWAILAFEILGIPLWLDAFIWLLFNAVTNDYAQIYDDCSYADDASSGSTYTCVEVSSTSNLSLWNAAIAAAAFAAAELVLSFVSLVVVSVFITRHRAAGGHSMHGSEAPIPSATIAQIARQTEELRMDQFELKKQVLGLQE